MEPVIPPYVIALVLGLCVGSFLNVCIYRIPEKKSILFPGSFCPACKKSIPFFLNIPILSYAVLGGRCRFCKTAIPIRYPFVELLTGCLALLTVHCFGPTSQALVWFGFASTLTTISFIDLDRQIIPDSISIPGTIIFAALGYLVLGIRIQDVLMGVFVGSGILYSVALIYYLVKKEQGMGGGDIKLMAMVGAVLGVKGALFTIFAGSLIGTVLGGLIMAFGKAVNIQQKIPFGPFLSLGALVYLFWGNQIIRWYFNMIGG